MNLEELKKKYCVAVAENKDREFNQIINNIEDVAVIGKDELRVVIEFGSTISRLRERGFTVYKTPYSEDINGKHEYKICGWSE